MATGICANRNRARIVKIFGAPSSLVQTNAQLLLVHSRVFHGRGKGVHE
jgi:hypothetical protein